MTKNYRSPELYEGVKRFVHSHGLIRRGSTVLAAVSGGIDSVVLLDLLTLLSVEWELQVVILHVNHQLRGREANADEKFVESLAKRYNFRIVYSARRDKKRSGKEKSFYSRSGEGSPLRLLSHEEGGIACRRRSNGA